MTAYTPKLVGIEALAGEIKDLRRQLAATRGARRTPLAELEWTDVAAFSGSWVNFYGNEHAAYRSAGDDETQLRGIVKSGTGIIFVLPPELWPAPNWQPRFVCVASGGAAFVYVSPIGEVAVASYIGGGTNAYLDLSPVRFSRTA